MLNINTNISSLYGQNSLAGAQSNLAASVQRLSSGLRINGAADDAAGLAISQNIQSQINGVNQSIQGLSNATSLLQVADSSLSSIQDMLLRMKQLATQGLDGSLSSSQRIDIANELDALNSEINETAKRTQFNGINIIASGVSVDQVSSSIHIGTSLVTEPVAISETGLGHYAVGGGAGINANLGDSALTQSGINSTFLVHLDSDKSKDAPGTYSLSNSGGLLTLSGFYKGQYQSQSVAVKDAASDSGSSLSKTIYQSIDFGSFGISIDVTTTVSSGATVTGSQLAQSIVDRGKYLSPSQSVLKIDGIGSEISDIRLTDAAPGSYSLTKIGTDRLKLSVASANGGATTEIIQVLSGEANKTQTLNFKSLGISLDVHSFQKQSASQIVDSIVASAGGSTSTVINNSGFASATGAITLNASTGYVLTVDGKKYSTKGTVDGVTNSQVGILSTNTTIDALETWINNLQQNLGVNISAKITGSGSSYELTINSTSSSTVGATGFVETATSSDPTVITAVADSTATGGVNTVTVQAGTAKTWSLTSADGHISVDPVNGFQLNVGGITYKSSDASPPIKGATTLADIATWITGLHVPVSGSPDMPINASISNGGKTLTLSGAASASNNFSVSGVASEMIGGFTSPSNLVAIGGSGLDLVVGTTHFNSNLHYLNQTAEGYSTLEDISNWVNSLGSSVSASIINDGVNGYALSLLNSSGVAAAVSLDGIRPSASEANFSSPLDAVTLDPTNGFKVVAGVGGSAVFSTNSIPVNGTRSDGAVTLSDLADWVNNLNAGLVASIGGGPDGPYTLNVRYAANNADMSPISLSGIVNGTTSSDVNVALATANVGAATGAHPLVVTQTAAATSCNLAGFMDENALVDVTNFDLFVGGNVYYANGTVANGASISIYLPGQSLPWGARSLQNHIDLTNASYSSRPALGDGWGGDSSVMVTVGQLRDWINGLGDNVESYTFSAPSGDIQLHINGTKTGVSNVVGFDNLGNMAISYSAEGWGSISTNYTNSVGGNYVAGTISLTASGGIDTSGSPAAYMLQGSDSAYQVVDDPRGIVYDGTTYMWAGPQSAVDINYRNDPTRGMVDPGNGLWYGQPGVVTDTSLGSLIGPLPNLPGQINGDGVVNFYGNYLTGDPGINSIVIARDAKGTIDGNYFQSDSNIINNAASSGINLNLTCAIAPSDMAANASIVVDEGVSNTPNQLNSSTVSVAESADAKGATVSINGVNYDPALQTIKVKGVTYNYLGGTSSSPITVTVSPVTTRQSTTDAGQGIVVEKNGPAALEFQSGATSNFHITVYTTNVMTGLNGSGDKKNLLALGNAFSVNQPGMLFSLTSLDATENWLSAFGRLSGMIDGAIDEISTQRSKYGSQINTISFNVSNLKSQSLSMEKTNSSIRDVDFAMETSKLVKGQIVEQAGAAMLAQANQNPSVVLSLLSGSFSNNYDMRNYVY